jgi:hypothetical protein
VACCGGYVQLGSAGGASTEVSSSELARPATSIGIPDR